MAFSSLGRSCLDSTGVLVVGPAETPGWGLRSEDGGRLGDPGAACNFVICVLDF